MASLLLILGVSKIKALFLRDGLKLSLEETEKPTLKEGHDMIVKVTAASICGSDLHFVSGEVPMTPNFIIGHEGVGIVEEVGPFVKNFKPGDRVVIPGGVACGTCPECRAGRHYACEKDLMFGAGKNKGDLPGVQAEYTRIPYADNSVVKIPDSVSFKQALLVGDVLSTGYIGVTYRPHSPAMISPFSAAVRSVYVRWLRPSCSAPPALLQLTWRITVWRRPQDGCHA